MNNRLNPATGCVLVVVLVSATLQTSYGQRFPLQTQTDPDIVVPGEFVIDPPTLENLGFEWFIDGDANRNARVDVAYREAGSTDWLPALSRSGRRAGAAGTSCTP